MDITVLSNTILFFRDIVLQKFYGSKVSLVQRTRNIEFLYSFLDSLT
jgi:hypothetical protein